MSDQKPNEETRRIYGLVTHLLSVSGVSMSDQTTPQDQMTQKEMQERIETLLMRMIAASNKAIF